MSGENEHLSRDCVSAGQAGRPQGCIPVVALRGLYIV